MKIAYSKSANEATKRYREKNNLKTVAIHFGVGEKDISDWLDKQPVKQRYIKSLIRKDMNENKKEE